MTKQSDELRTIADTIETNGGWHIAALKVRAAADEIERQQEELETHLRVHLSVVAENQRLRSLLPNRGAK